MARFLLPACVMMDDHQILQSAKMLMVQVAVRLPDGIERLRAYLDYIDLQLFDCEESTMPPLHS
jgi:hypothetical protein